MFKNAKAQREKMNDLITRAESIVNVAESEKRELTEAEAQELAEIRDNVKAIKDFLGIDKDLDEASAEVNDGAGAGAEGGETRAKESDKEVELREYRQFDAFLRNTVNTRDGELAPANNGKIIPTTIAKKIIARVYDICPILEKSDKYNVKGKLSIPVYPADVSSQTAVAFANEFEELASTTGDFTTVDLTGYLAGALTKVSKSLVNNVDFDLVGYVVNRMADAIARFIEKNLLGLGGGSVAGLGDATNVVTASAIDGDVLIDVQGAVKDVYQADAMWIMSTATRNALRKLKDDVGRYLLQDDITAPFGKTLLGKPVYVSDNMPNVANNAKAIFYGDFSGLGTKFSEQIDIEVLRERFATQHAIGVVGWIEFDSKTLDNQKIAVLKISTGA
jgi:HK97 family phage major capsid protein